MNENFGGSRAGGTGFDVKLALRSTIVNGLI